MKRMRFIVLAACAGVVLAISIVTLIARRTYIREIRIAQEKNDAECREASAVVSLLATSNYRGLLDFLPKANFFSSQIIEWLKGQQGRDVLRDLEAVYARCGSSWDAKWGIAELWANADDERGLQILLKDINGMIDAQDVPPGTFLSILPRFKAGRKERGDVFLKFLEQPAKLQNSPAEAEYLLEIRPLIYEWLAEMGDVRAISCAKRDVKAQNSTKATREAASAYIAAMRP